MKLRSRESLRAFMYQAGLSHRRLAERAGVRHHSTIDHLLAGRRESLTDKEATAIAEAVGVDPAVLWETS